MKRSIIFFLLKIVITTFSFAQKKEVLLSGIVKDSKSGLPIENAVISFSGLSVGIITDIDGKFAINLVPKSYQMVIRNLGYKPTIERFSLDSNKEMEIRLELKEKLLDEVVISAEKADANVNRAIMGVENISGKTLKKLPTLMGEADVIRSIMLLPGISTVGEGASGFNVRGGNVDQNLLLLDGVPLFNTSHLFGFFTGFNSDMVQDLSIFKGGIPSNYGGRASSVLDVRLKEGDFEKWIFQGGLGPVASRLLLEGPIFKKQTSIIIGARASLSDFYLKYFKNPSLQKSRATFNDFNGKITHKFGKNQRISIATYSSKDVFKFAQDTVYNWDTRNVYMKHNALINNKISHNFTAFWSEYQYGNKGQRDFYEYTWQPRITQKTLREDLNVDINDTNHFYYGGEASYYTNDEGSFLPNSSTSIIDPFKMPIEHARELSIYVGNNRAITKKINLDFGLRYVKFQLIGPGIYYKYQVGKPRETTTIKDTLSFQKGQLVKAYGGLEPRISASLKIGSSLSLKVGFNRMQQFIHLLSNTMAISPADIWKFSNPQLPQQIADQFSLGIFKNFGNATSPTYETSIESYYKNLKNVIDYVDGASLYLNPTVETELLIGRGYAYGVELFVKKSRGTNLTGWISYTYARTFRQALATDEQTGSNFGLRFPSNFDTPHNFKAVVNNRFSKRFSFNANFTYTTGRPITYPNGRYKLYAFNDVYNYLIDNNLIPRTGLGVENYIYQGVTYKYLNTTKINEVLDGYSVPSFTLRNQERLPDYVRLDVGITLDPKVSSKSGSTWNFSIYNILGRQNVFSIYFRSTTGLRNQARTYKLSVLAVAIPSLTYNFKF